MNCGPERKTLTARTCKQLAEPRRDSPGILVADLDQAFACSAILRLRLGCNEITYNQAARLIRFCRQRFPYRSDSLKRERHRSEGPPWSSPTLWSLSLQPSERSSSYGHSGSLSPSPLRRSWGALPRLWSRFVSGQVSRPLRLETHVADACSAKSEWAARNPCWRRIGRHAGGETPGGCLDPEGLEGPFSPVIRTGEQLHRDPRTFRSGFGALNTMRRNAIAVFTKRITSSAEREARRELRRRIRPPGLRGCWPRGRPVDCHVSWSAPFCALIHDDILAQRDFGSVAQTTADCFFATIP